MNAAKHFLILGLGSFGSALALRLTKNGCRVTVIDRSPKAVDAIKEHVYEAVIGDATDRELLENMSVPNYEVVAIALGESIERSLLATLHIKELGAKRVFAKGITADHGKLLSRLEVERVVFAEDEMAELLGDQLTWPNVLDFVRIDPEYSFVEVAAPDTLAGKTIGEADLRRQTGLWIVGIKDVLSGKLQMFPDAQFMLKVDQLLLVIGRAEDIKRLNDLK